VHFYSALYQTASTHALIISKGIFCIAAVDIIPCLLLKIASTMMSFSLLYFTGKHYRHSSLIRPLYYWSHYNFRLFIIGATTTFAPFIIGATD
jgi:hypothetical protein